MDASRLSDTWERGNPYEDYVGRWSRQVAPAFLSWLNIPAGRRWLDVGCGTGALCAAVVDRCSPGTVVGVEPSQGFLETAPGEVTVQFAVGPRAGPPKGPLCRSEARLTCSVAGRDVKPVTPVHMTGAQIAC